MKINAEKIFPEIFCKKREFFSIPIIISFYDEFLQDNGNMTKTAGKS